MKTLSPLGANCSCFHYNSDVQTSSLYTSYKSGNYHSILGRLALLLLLIVASYGITTANTFTATHNGPWGNPETWSGNSPGNIISNPDTVIIPTGIVVMLGSDVNVSSQQALVIVNGTLEGDPSLIMGSGNLAGAGTLQNVTVNIQSKGVVYLRSDIAITGQLSLLQGSLSLNGYNLTLQGSISCTGTGSLIATPTSGLVFNGNAPSGNLVFAGRANQLATLTMAAKTSTAISLGSDMFIGTRLGLYNGLINLGNNTITIGDTAQVLGGSAHSYLVTDPGESGRLVMHINGNGGFGTFVVGTASNYAPVRIDNNSPGGGNFSGYVQSGVYTDGSSGSLPGNDAGAVNATWHLWSNVTAPAAVLVSVFWSADMANNSFNPGQVYISQYQNNAWDSSPAALAFMQANGLYMAQRSGFTAYGPLAVFSRVAGNTATTDLNVDAGISVYPVPASTQVNLLLPQHQKYSRISVYDVLGKQVYEALPEADLTTINISNFSPGEYFIRVDDAVTKRFIKN